jgi:hypothetical protein
LGPRRGDVAGEARRRWAAAALAVSAGVVTAPSCGHAAPVAGAIRWVSVADQTFGSPGAQLHLTTAAASASGQPWLVGGDTLTSDGVTHVGIWSASSPTGPWKRARMQAVPDRDGPYETVLGFGRVAGRTVALGSRTSPEEGYPRPSTWTGDGAATSWREALAGRELFGGPDIVALGGITGGPHGYSVAGTWVGPSGRPGVAVWRSSDGAHWARNDSDPALVGDAGETPLALDAADNRRGILVVGMASAPLPDQPGHQRGAMWYSPTGASWRRLPASDSRLDPPGHTSVTAVRALGDGWVAAGTTGDGETTRPTIWTVGADLRLRSRTLPVDAGQSPDAMSGVTVSGLSVSATTAVAAGVSGGQPVLWAAAVDHGRLGPWRRLRPGPGPVPEGLRTVAVAAGSAGTVTAVLNGSTTSELWVGRPTTN